MVVVPQSALIADQEGVYVFVVEDGKAVVKRIEPGVRAERIPSSRKACPGTNR